MAITITFIRLQYEAIEQLPDSPRRLFVECSRRLFLYIIQKQTSFNFIVLAFIVSESIIDSSVDADQEYKNLDGHVIQVNVFHAFLCLLCGTIMPAEALI